MLDQLFNEYPSLETEIDQVNDSIRVCHLSESEVKLFDNIVSTLDQLPSLTGVRLYRGLVEFKPEYLKDPGITFKTSKLKVALTYAEKALLIIDYPEDTKQIYINRNNEDEYISYPGENLNLVHVQPYNEQITIYYLIFNGILFDYHTLYYPEKEAKIKEITTNLVKKIKSGSPVKIILTNPSEEINITSNYPYKQTSRNIICIKNLIPEIIYSNRLIEII